MAETNGETKYLGSDQGMVEAIRKLKPEFQESIKLLQLMPEAVVAVACGKGWEDVSKPKHFDQIFNPGQLSAMSPEGRDTAIAAGLLFMAGKVKEIKCSGGRTAGNDGMSEALAMKYLIRELFPDIPAEAVKLDEESYSTGANAQLLKQMGASEQNAIVLTVNYHLARVKNTFEREWGKTALTQKDVLNGSFVDGMPEDKFIVLESDTFVSNIIGNNDLANKYRERTKASTIFEFIREPVARFLDANKWTRKLMESAAKAKRSK